MAVWLVRAGAQGQYEQKFIQENRIYLTWDELNTPLDKLPDRDSLISTLAEIDSDAKPKKLMNHASQIWPFAHTMQFIIWLCWIFCRLYSGQSNLPCSSCK